MASSDATIPDLKDARLAADMTHAHLARAAGLSVRTVERAESGAPVSAETRRSIAAVLGPGTRASVASPVVGRQVASGPADTATDPAPSRGRATTIGPDVAMAALGAILAVVVIAADAFSVAPSWAVLGAVEMDLIFLVGAPLALAFWTPFRVEIGAVPGDRVFRRPVFALLFVYFGIVVFDRGFVGFAWVDQVARHPATIYPSGWRSDLPTLVDLVAAGVLCAGFFAWGASRRLRLGGSVRHASVA